MDLDLDVLSDEELRDEITTWAGRVAAGDARLLHLIGELDAREAWGMHGVLSCAHWVAWRLGLTQVTAQEKVRVARALRGLPLVAAAFGQGRVSYAQVRALTRCATAADEQGWLELARHCTAEQLEKAQRGAARARRNEQRRTDPDTVAWQDQVRTRWDDDGTLVLTVRVTPEHAPAVLAALEQARAEEQAERDARLAALATELAAAEGCGEPASAESGDTSEGAGAGPDDEADGDTADGDEPTGSALATAVGCGELLSAEGGDATAGGGAGPEGCDPAGAECGQPLSAESPEPYVFEEPPYPVLAERPFGQPPSAEDRQALKAYWDELHHRQAKADAWQAHQERLRTEAAARDLPAAKATLGDALIRALTRPSDKKVKVQLLLDPLSGWARTVHDELLPPSTLRQMNLPSPRVPAPASELTGCDLGRDHRDVSPALRALLGHLDGERCRFPSCARTRNLHAHHVIWWSQGGRTDLANLILVCSRHHTLIHRDGYQLTLRPDRTLEVRTADGTVVPPRLALPWASAEELDSSIGPATLPTDWTGERMDLGYVVNVMLPHAA